jgi:hypothetical protein
LVWYVSRYPERTEGKGLRLEVAIASPTLFELGVMVRVFC